MIANPLPVAIVLGGTSAHAILITNLHARGYTTVLVDYLENPPAASLAGRHIRESTLDVATVAQIARDHNAALVIATSVDQANVVACEVSEILGLPHPYSGTTGHTIANKTLVKQRMVALGIPTAKHISLKNTADLDTVLRTADLAFPLIVKPADSNGSKGVMRCDTLSELATGIDRALDYSRTAEAIVEDFIDGTEYNIYALLSDGKPHIITACRKYNHDSTDDTAITSYATWYQNRLPDWFAAKLNTILDQIAQGFALSNTAMILQVLVSDRDVSVLEFAPRVGGGLSYWAVALQAKCDLVDCMIEAWLGNPPTLPDQIDSDIVITTHLYAHPCTFDRIDGVDVLLQDGTIEDYIPNKTHGGTISAEKASRDRVGSFVLRGKTDADILKRVARIMQTVRVFDMQGRDVMDTETYIRSVD